MYIKYINEISALTKYKMLQIAGKTLFFLATHLYLYYLVGKDTFLSYLTSEAYNLYIYK